MSESQFTTPLIISNHGASKLNRIPLVSNNDGNGYNEEWIQKIAFENPECLPVNEIDSTYQDIIPVCMELSTPVGPIDALYVTALGQLVLLEAKLWRNPEARREVVGQILDYAKEFTRWTYEDLQREVSKRTGRKGNVLYELAKESVPELDEANFVDNVSRSLQRGDFLLLIVGDGIREGVEAIAEYLDKYAGVNFTLGLVELGVYSINEEERLIKPRLLAKTTIFKRTVIEFEERRPEINETSGESDTSGDLNEDQKFYLNFWKKLFAQLDFDDPSQSLPRTAPKSQNFYLPMPPSQSQAWVTVFMAGSTNEVGVFLTFTRGELANHVYQTLIEEKDVIVKDIGIPLSWESDGEKHKIISRLSITEIRAEQNEDKLLTYYSDTINRFVNTFRPRLQRISQEFGD
jgi:hypothetical protein